MKDKNRVKLKLPKIKLTLDEEKKYESIMNHKFRKPIDEIFNDESNDNEWAQEYYLIYNSHQMLYGNDA